MENRTLTAMAERIEAGTTLDAALAAEAARLLDEALPGKGILTAFKGAQGTGTDAILHIVDLALPGWSIRIRGTAREPDGHWTCTLREVGVRDDDETIGIGTAPSLAQALFAALLESVARRGG